MPGVAPLMPSILSISTHLAPTLLPVSLFLAVLEDPGATVAGQFSVAQRTMLCPNDE
jgi:hypothetical protein